MLPEDQEGPSATIRARRTEYGPGIAFSVWPHSHQGWIGETMMTIVVPDAECAARDEALWRLSMRLDRWSEIETMMRAGRRWGPAETGTGTDDVPAWRTHCPTALRLWCDHVGMDDDERQRIGENHAIPGIGRARIRVNETSTDCAVAHRTRAIRRVTITAPGAKFSQGINKCYLTINQRLPETVHMNVMGKPVSRLVDLPGLEWPGMTVVDIHRNDRKGTTTFDLNRGHSMLAPVPERLL